MRLHSKNLQFKEVRVEKPKGKLQMESDGKTAYFHMQV